MVKWEYESVCERYKTSELWNTLWDFFPNTKSGMRVTMSKSHK